MRRTKVMMLFSWVFQLMQPPLLLADINLLIGLTYRCMSMSFMNVIYVIYEFNQNVIYEFTCSCDANLTYIGMSTRHLSIRAKEHLDFNSQVSSAIKNHIMCCNVCSSVKLNLNSFKIIKKCKSEFHTKIHEALFIKKRNPGLNRQLYANGSSFLLNVF